MSIERVQPINVYFPFFAESERQKIPSDIERKTAWCKKLFQAFLLFQKEPSKSFYYLNYAVFYISAKPEMV